MQTVVRCRQCGKSYSAGVVNRDFEGVCPNCVAAFALFDDVSRSPLETVKSPPPPSDDARTTLFLTPGTLIQGVEIIEVLGQGGMGIVYKGRQQGLDRIVALKVMSDRLAGDAEFVKRFEKEAKAMAALSHPNIVGVFNFGIDAGRCFIVMEFVDGANLRQLLRERKLTPGEALKIVPQLCDALEYAHEEGVVHRDIKPENILLDRRGRVKITDFGLAKLANAAAHGTLTGLVMGTPHYMAPEQVEAPKDVDHRADIYSMGVVLYELLTGELPIGRFQLPSEQGTVDVRLDQVVLRALEKRRDARYQRAGEMRDEVSRVSEFIPVARMASRPPQVAAAGSPAAPPPAHRVEARLQVGGPHAASPGHPSPPSRMSGWIGTGFGLSLAGLILGLIALLVAWASSSVTGSAVVGGIAASLVGVGTLCAVIGTVDLLFAAGKKHGFGLAVLTFCFDFAFLVLIGITFMVAQKPGGARIGPFGVPSPVSGADAEIADPFHSSIERPLYWQRRTAESARTSSELRSAWSRTGGPGNPDGIVRAHRVEYATRSAGASASYLVMELAPGVDPETVRVRLPVMNDWFGQGRVWVALYAPTPMTPDDVHSYALVRSSLGKAVEGAAPPVEVEAAPERRR